MKRRLIKILSGVFLLALVVGLAGSWWMRSWIAQPPPLPADVAIMRQKPELRDGRRWLGQSWLARREGVFVVRLKGSPFAMGYASGVLLTDQMHTLENEFLDMIHGYVPQPWKVNLLKSYVLYRTRHLSHFVPLD